ncbi:MAG: ABC transporter ATP-binding protein/permease [Ruminococcus flavefaciens]|nr:ABC transporter ATP-binding protein/permease [Ruminococcus flavefaciens]
MKKNREPRKKPYRSVWSNILWSFQGAAKGTPAALALMAVNIPLEVFTAYAGVYLPSLVVAEVTGGKDLSHAAFRVGSLIAAMAAAAMLHRFTDVLSQSYLMAYRFQRSAEIDRKSMECFYQDYEKKENRDLCQRAKTATEMWNGSQPIFDVPMQTGNLVKNIICYCLFGSVILAVSPVLIPLLTVAPAVNWLCAGAYRRWEYSHRSKWTDIDSKIGYTQRASSDFAAAKDVRIYGMAGWFRDIFRELTRQRSVWDKRLVWREFVSKIAELFVILLRDGASYALLIAMTLRGEITVDRFVLYFSAISMFAEFIGSIMNSWNRIHTAGLSVCDFREYMDLAERDGAEEPRGEGDEKLSEKREAGSGKGRSSALHGERDEKLSEESGTEIRNSRLSAEQFSGRPPEITFEHVSFRYDGAEEDTLQDVSFTIRAGEKVALVGLNGAGKTTLVKLLCGLYRPTGGDILIDGVSVRRFARKDYYRLFSPVFQETKAAFFSLAETVSGKIGGGADESRVEECMRLAGLGEKLDSLPLGIHTRLDKQVNKDGTEFSGGELQKLMFARALYKDAPVLVLDEPTAALDPIAENRLYQQYRSLTDRKTSLFISHRLASTQFCDRILYLKGGKLTEVGTHRELMALDGEYSSLYEIQSCWYRESNILPQAGHQA